MLTIRRTIQAGIAMTLCLTILGCTGLTLGPRTRTAYIMVIPGKPLVILSQTTVTGRRLDVAADSPTIQQDIGGWVAMPQAHFDALMRAAKKGVDP